MSRSITIRDVPDETAMELAARAALVGRSLQEYLRGRLIEMTERPDAEAWVARVQARKALDPTPRLSSEQILELLHEGRT